MRKKEINRTSKIRRQYYILIDESGTLPDLKDKFIVIAGVGVRKLKEGKNLIQRALSLLRQRRIKKRKITIREIKFYYVSERTKREVLSGIAATGLEIFVLAVDKKRRKIPDTPENFGLLVSELINEIGLWQREQTSFLKIIIDRHFHRKVDERNFNRLLQKNIRRGLNYRIQHIDSQQNPVVNLADFVAGATLAKYNKNNFQFYDLIKENILFEKIVNWPELKRKSLGK